MDLAVARMSVKTAPTPGVRPGAPTALVEFSDSEFDALEKILRHVKKTGMGAVEFNPKLIDPMRRKLRAAGHAIGLPFADIAHPDSERGAR